MSDLDAHRHLAALQDRLAAVGSPTPHARLEDAAHVLHVPIALRLGVKAFQEGNANAAKKYLLHASTAGAAVLEAHGHLPEAAELLIDSGDPLRAAHLYVRAAVAANKRGDQREFASRAVEIFEGAKRPKEGLRAFERHVGQRPGFENHFTTLRRLAGVAERGPRNP
jgi:hypothetical protein